MIWNGFGNCTVYSSFLQHVNAVFFWRLASSSFNILNILKTGIIRGMASSSYSILNTMHRQNIPRQNVPRHKVPGTKRPRDKTSQGTKHPKDKLSQETKHPKGQNVPRDKTSYTNYQVLKNTFCVRKLATYVR